MRRVILILALSMTGLRISAQTPQAKPISQLPAATLPLTGTELLPVVQGGITKSVMTDAVKAMATDSQSLRFQNDTLYISRGNNVLIETSKSGRVDSASINQDSLIVLLKDGTRQVNRLRNDSAFFAGKIRNDSIALVNSSRSLDSFSFKINGTNLVNYADGFGPFVTLGTKSGVDLRFSIGGQSAGYISAYYGTARNHIIGIGAAAMVGGTYDNAGFGYNVFNGASGGNNSAFGAYSFKGSTGSNGL